MLVNFEAKLENVKTVEKQRLMEEYSDMIEWLMLLNRNPRQRQLEENMKPVTIAYGYIDEIVQIVEGSEQKLKQDRNEIENGLMDQVKNFQKEIDETKKNVTDYKDHNNQKKVDEYRRNIDEIKTKLSLLSKEMIHINEQQ